MPSQLWLERSGDNLLLRRLEGCTDRLTVVGWFVEPGNRIARFELPDGRYLAGERMDALLAVVNSMSSNGKKRGKDEQALLDAALAEAWISP